MNRGHIDFGDEQRSQITLGGGPNNAAISAKSESSETNVKPLALA